MTTTTMLLLLQLLLLLGASDALLFQRIRLPVYQSQYVLVRVGIPGKLLTLRMRFDLDQTFLYSSPFDYSATFTASGSDIFQFNGVRIRLPVIYGQEPGQLVSPFLPFYNGLRQDTAGGVAYAGVLGLGEGSAIWSHFTKATLSRFSLSLGGYDDLDAATHTAGITSRFGFSADFQCLPPSNSTWPLIFSLPEDFTYVPLSLFPHLWHMLDHSGDHEIEASLAPTLVDGCIDQSQESLRFGISADSSFITSSFGSPERILRFAEREGKNTSAVTLGRIHILQDFIIFFDMVTNRTRVQQVFDSFPSMPTGQAPQAFLSVLLLLLWTWYSMETAPMTYTWLMFGMYPRMKQLVHAIKTANLDWMSDAAAARKQQTQKIGAALFEFPQAIDPYDPADPFATSDVPPVARRLAPPSPTSAIALGPIDWTVLECILALTRVFCFWTFFTAVFGFQSARFVERLARTAYLPSGVGTAAFYMLVSYVLAIPFLVNTSVIRRYTHAGSTLIHTALLGAIWICQLPDTSSVFFSLVINLLFSTLFAFRMFEWLFYWPLRGSDSAISMTLEDADELPTDQELAASSASVASLPSRAMAEVRNYAAATVRSLRLDQQGLPRGYTDVPHEPEHRFHNQPVGNYQLEMRVAQRRVTAGEVVMRVLWLVVLLPCTALWLILINALPLIETLFPNSPVRIWLAILYTFGCVAFYSYIHACRTLLQVTQEGLIELREALIAFEERVLAKHKELISSK